MRAATVLKLEPIYYFHRNMLRQHGLLAHILKKPADVKEAL